MTAQLELVPALPPEPVLAIEEPLTRFRSPICRPGYRKGQPSPNKGKTLPAEVLTRDEILAILATFNKGPTGRRNYALTTVLWRAGLRVGEAVNLRAPDIDFEQNTIRVLRGKTANANRTVGIDPEALEEVKTWMDIRAGLGVHRLSPVFCTVAQDVVGRPLNTAYVRNFLRHAADLAGIQKRVHPHGLRHCHAAELAQEGVDIRIIAQQLGHSNIAITHRYVSHLWPGAAIQAMSARSWKDAA